MSDVDWAFGPEQDVKCPECQKIATGVTWILTDGDEIDPAVGPETIGMELTCGHQLPLDLWKLEPSGPRGQLQLTKITD